MQNYRVNVKFPNIMNTYYSQNIIKDFYTLYNYIEKFSI